MRIAAIIAAFSVVSIAAGVFYLRGGSTPVAVDTAIERFRTTTLGASQPLIDTDATPKADTSKPKKAQTPVATAASVAEPRSEAGRPKPPEGVYVYATKGGDEVDVLGGSSHAYPAETTMTIRHDGCGLIERWDALDERWDERETCKTPDGDALKRFTSFHEFFRHADERTYTCEFLTYPRDTRPGDTWKGRCVSGESVVHQTGRAIGYETLLVGGIRVKTLHVRVDVKLTGEQEGSGVRQVWGDLETGLSILERASTTSYSTQPVFGRTRYHESFEIRLKSLKPRT
jgi:hypothetical protein